MSAPITVIGSSNIDFTMNVEQLPDRGETVTNGRFMQTFGGKGANQAVAAARAGGAVTFVTCLGDDPYAAQIVANYEADGIDTSHVFRDVGVSSGAALVMFDRRGDNYLTVAPGSNGRLTAERILACEGTIRSSAVVLLQMEIPVPAVAAALELARRHGVRTMLNYAPARDLSLDIGTGVDILAVNEIEAGLLTGRTVSTDEDALAAAGELLARGPGEIVLTLGAGGAFLVTDGQCERVPAFSVEPVDTTAAGDTFCGAYAVARTEGAGLRAAAQFANAAAALSVTQMGAQPSIPRRTDIDAMLGDADR